MEQPDLEVSGATTLKSFVNYYLNKFVIVYFMCMYFLVYCMFHHRYLVFYKSMVLP